MKSHNNYYLDEAKTVYVLDDGRLNIHMLSLNQLFKEYYGNAIANLVPSSNYILKRIKI